MILRSLFDLFFSSTLSFSHAIQERFRLEYSFPVVLKLQNILLKKRNSVPERSKNKEQKIELDRDRGRKVKKEEEEKMIQKKARRKTPLEVQLTNWH